MHGRGCKHGQCLMPQGIVCYLAGVQCCRKPIGSVGVLQGRHGRRLPVSSTLGWCSALPVYGFACQPALWFCMVMVCMLCDTQCSLCRVCALITCRASQHIGAHTRHSATGVGAALGTPQQQPGLGSIWLADACGPACQCCGGRRNYQV